MVERQRSSLEHRRVNRYGVMDQKHSITPQLASDKQRAIEQIHAFTTSDECPLNHSKWDELPTPDVDVGCPFTRGIAQFVQTNEHAAHHPACDAQTRILPSFLELMCEVESVSVCTFNVFDDTPNCGGLHAKTSFDHTRTMRRQGTSGELPLRSFGNTKSPCAASVRSESTQHTTTPLNLCLQLQPRNHQHEIRKETRGYQLTPHLFDTTKCD